ncbi:MAG: M20/M25/M40 family metallo-hydrolase [Thomasclavelia sp.]
MNHNSATYEFEFIRQFPPLVNDKNMADVLEKAAKKIVGDENVFELATPSMGGEDFAFYAQESTFIICICGNGKRCRKSNITSQC